MRLDGSSLQISGAATLRDLSARRVQVLDGASEVHVDGGPPRVRPGQTEVTVVGRSART